MEGYSGPAHHAREPLEAIGRSHNAPTWKSEAALKCRSCRKGRYASPVHMIKLTEQWEITIGVRVLRRNRRCDISGGCFTLTVRFLSACRRARPQT